MRPVLRVLGRVAVWGAALLAFGGLCAAVFVLGLRAALVHDFKQAEVTVPDVMGLDEASAEEKLRGVSLELTVQARKERDGVDEGRIFFQDPLGGTRTRRGRQVKVLVSAGAEEAGVPDLAGQIQRQAIVTLTNAKLRIGDVLHVHSDRFEPNQIIAQSPPAGSRASASERVDVIVSLGPPPRAYVMPDLRGQPRERVESVLGTAGVRVGEVHEAAVPGLASGLVASQVPLPGSRVLRGDAVSLVVARPAGSVPAPPPGAGTPSAVPVVPH